MMVGHCHSSHSHHHHHPRHHHHHRLYRAGSSSSRDEQCGGGGNNETPSPPSSPSSSDYSLAISPTSSTDGGDRALHHHHHHPHSSSTASLLDTIERRTQRTYRYGIGLVCVGATLNWLGFAQGTTYIDPLRYLGVACVLTGSFCVCLAMCRWLGRPISVSGHHPTNFEDDRSNDVHVINVPVPVFVPSLTEEYRPAKPPDYEQIVAGEPPPYDEAIKLSPGAFFGPPPTTSCEVDADQEETFASHLPPCQPSPSHHHYRSQFPVTGDLTRALLLDHHDSDIISCSAVETQPPTSSKLPRVHKNHVKSLLGSDPPPAYEPSPISSNTSCSSNTPLIATPISSVELPPSFSVRRIFGGDSSASSSHSPMSRGLVVQESNHYHPHLVRGVNNSENLQEEVNNHEGTAFGS